MGSAEDELEEIRLATNLRTVGPLLWEFPAHDVTVGDVLIDVYDVTNLDFAVFVTANPEWGRAGLDESQHNGRYLEHWSEDGPPENLLNHPVTFITWREAVLKRRPITPPGPATKL